MTRLITIIFLMLQAVFAAQAHAANSVYLEDLTWMEVRTKLASGMTTAIIPTGGTEQSGPQMILGKHNLIVRFTSGEIAKRLGNALVAPVIPYSPAGRINPPEGHMQFPGTISLTPESFAMILEDTARSLQQHGFKTICFVGDHGGSQDTQNRVANKLNSEWAGSGIVVMNVSDYYDKNNGQEKWAQSIGAKVNNPTAHAGFFDTSELMAVYAPGVYNDKFAARTDRDYKATGAMGDSTNASANYGRRLLSLKIEAAVAQIKSQAARGN